MKINDRSIPNNIRKRPAYLVKIKHGPNRKGEIPHSLASIEKAKELLGYEPSHRIEEGVKETVEWYWNNLK